MKVTMQGIAELEGVSHSTVSFVLRGRDMSISAGTRRRILMRATSLAYRPRSDQRIDSLKSSVLFLVPGYDDIYGKDSYAGRLFSKMSSLEKEFGIRTIIHTNTERDIIHSLYRGVCEDVVSAVVALNLGLEELVEVVGTSPVPVISPSQWSREICSRVAFDDFWIGEEAARRFFHAGHRNAALFKSARYMSDRREGFRREWQKLGGELTWIEMPSYVSPSAVCDKLTGIFSGKIGFTALFCGNDGIAMGVMLAMYRCGLSVPEDLSLIGCDNNPHSVFSHPPLCTFDLDANEHARQLLLAVKRLVAGDEKMVYISLKPDFVMRESIRELSN